MGSGSLDQAIRQRAIHNLTITPRPRNVWAGEKVLIKARYCVDMWKHEIQMNALMSDGTKVQGEGCHTVSRRRAERVGDPEGCRSFLAKCEIDIPPEAVGGDRELELIFHRKKRPDKVFATRHVSGKVYKVKPLPVDCFGVINGSAVVDDCGVCDGGNADKDCAGVCFGPAQVDECGVCEGYNECQLTWAGCNYKGSNLSTEEQLTCEENFRTMPDARLYGVQWIFLHEAAGSKTHYVNKSMAELNRVFAHLNMGFKTDEILYFSGMLSENNSGSPSHTLSALMPDAAKFLGISYVSPEETLTALQNRLKENYVADNKAAALDLNQTISVWDFFRIIARTSPESITIFVHQRTSAGGLASGPVIDYQNVYQNIIELHTGMPTQVVTHEMGHYFGLQHTFGTQQSQAEDDYNFDFYKGTLAPVGRNLLNNIADGTVNLDVPTYYLPYDAGATQLLTFFQEALALGRFWPQVDLTYFNDGVRQKFSSFGQLWQHGNSGESLYYKDFYRNPTTSGAWYGWSCYFDSNAFNVECRYGTSEELYAGYEDLLDGSIAFEGSTVGNIMSYMHMPNDNGTSQRSGISAHQGDVIRLMGNTPGALLLRNYAL
ncbi:MAG: hypothetical protein CMH60_02020 [Myxococcales bacterium]|nr:hypothetical protein [Myxococcales bacterium]